MSAAGEKEPLLQKGEVEGTTKVKDVTVKLTKDPSSAKNASGKNRFNLLFFKRFWCILLVAVPKVLSVSMLLLVLLVLIRAAEEYNYYQMGVLPSQFYAALAGKNLADFKDILWKMIIIVISVCICKSGGEFVAGLVHVKWREVITKHLHSHYFYNRTYYRLNVINKLVDNPDQRITQDVDRFCDEVSQALPKIILQPFLIGYYSYRTFISLGWFGVLGVYAFFVISTVVNKFIMGPIVSYVFVQERREGDFRFHHVQVRSNAEAVAFYKGGSLEAKISNQRLKLLLQAQLGSVHWQLPLNFSVFMFDYVSTIISYSLVGAAIFSGMYDSYGPAQLASVISKNTFFSMYLLNNFSTVVDTAVKFAEIAGYTHRIGQFLEVLKVLDKERREEEAARDGTCKEQELAITSPSSDDSHKGDSKSPVELSPAMPSVSQTKVSLLPPQCVEMVAVFRDVSIAPPGELFPLIEGLNLEFRKGKNIMITGETGTGKTSIFRVLSGLWEPLKGHAELCVENNLHYVMFLSQRTHLTIGTLADQVAYPERPKTVDPHESGAVETKINECLALTGLISLRDRLGGIHMPVAENWCDIVTPGEAQRIAFARIFYHLPPFVFLDEVTSALSEESEEMLYTKMVDLGITFMSIGQRSSLKKFHHQLLKLRTDGSWSSDSVQQ